MLKYQFLPGMDCNTLMIKTPIRNRHIFLNSSMPAIMAIAVSVLAMSYRSEIFLFVFNIFMNSSMPIFAHKYKKNMASLDVRCIFIKQSW